MSTETGGTTGIGSSDDIADTGDFGSVDDIDDSLSIQEVVRLTGLTSKTLRHWEKVGLLAAGRDYKGYRLYQPDDLTRIFYIMSLRDLDLPLPAIRTVLDGQADGREALSAHLTRLQARQGQLSALISHLTSKLEKGDYTMHTDDFETLKATALATNEEEYGSEIRAKYGENTVTEFNRKFMAMSQSQLSEAKAQHAHIVELLEQAYESQDDKLAREAVELHRAWLEHFWPADLMSPKAHIGMGEMYVADPRFRQNYDRAIPGLTEYFRDHIVKYYDSCDEVSGGYYQHNPE